MCSPLMIAGSALSAGGSFLGIRDQQRAIDAANENQRIVSERTTQNVIEAAARAGEATARRTRQEDTATAVELARVGRQADLLVGESEAGAGAAGVEGASVRALQRDFRLQETLAKKVIRDNRGFTGEQINLEARNTQARFQSAINNAAPQFQSSPSLLGSFLQIGAAGLGGMTTFVSPAPGGGFINKFTGNRIKL